MICEDETQAKYHLKLFLKTLSELQFIPNGHILFTCTDLESAWVEFKHLLYVFSNWNFYTAVPVHLKLVSLSKINSNKKHNAQAYLKKDRTKEHNLSKNICNKNLAWDVNLVVGTLCLLFSHSLMSSHPSFRSIILLEDSYANRVQEMRWFSRSTWNSGFCVP